MQRPPLVAPDLLFPITHLFAIRRRSICAPVHVFSRTLSSRASSRRRAPPLIEAVAGDCGSQIVFGSLCIRLLHRALLSRTGPQIPSRHPPSFPLSSAISPLSSPPLGMFLTVSVIRPSNFPIMSAGPLYPRRNLTTVPGTTPSSREARGRPSPLVGQGYNSVTRYSVLFGRLVVYYASPPH